MLIKASSELTLFDRLSRLSFHSAARLLGAQGSRLITAGGKYDIDIFTQVQFDWDRFQLTLGGSVVTLSLHPAARDRLEWRCSTCDVACEHAGAAFSLILEEKLALGLANAPPDRPPVESLAEQALVAQAIAERKERARTEEMRLTSLSPGEIWADYTLTNSASGKSYRVALRGWQPGESYCSLVGHGPAPLTGGPGPCDPLSNRACRFPAHGLPMIFEVWLASDSTRCPSADGGPCHGVAGE